MNEYFIIFETSFSKKSLRDGSWYCDVEFVKSIEEP